MGMGEVGGTAETGPGTMSRVHSTRSTCSILHHFTLHQQVTEWQLEFPELVPRSSTGISPLRRDMSRLISRKLKGHSWTLRSLYGGIAGR
eukprot:1987992-Rhodomonas_salina.1